MGNKEIKGVVMFMVGDAALIAAVSLGINRLFSRGSRSREDEASSEGLKSNRDEVVSSNSTEPEEEWPSVARKIAAAWLVVAEGPSKGAHHAVGEGATVIGRGSSCDIVLVDSSISRHHARILKQGDQFFIYDLHSTNGTFVDGKTVDPSRGALLTDGRVICIGQTSLMFKEG